MEKIVPGGVLCGLTKEDFEKLEGKAPKEEKAVEPKPVEPKAPVKKPTTKK